MVKTFTRFAVCSFVAALVAPPAMSSELGELKALIEAQRRMEELGQTEVASIRQIEQTGTEGEAVCEKGLSGETIGAARNRRSVATETVRVKCLVGCFAQAWVSAEPESYQQKGLFHSPIQQNTCHCEYAQTQWYLRVAKRLPIQDRA